MTVVSRNVPLTCSARIRPSAGDFSLHTVDVQASRHMLAHLAVKHGLLLNVGCLRGGTPSVLPGGVTAGGCLELTLYFSYERSRSRSPCTVPTMASATYEPTV